MECVTQGGAIGAKNRTHLEVLDQDFGAGVVVLLVGELLQDLLPRLFRVKPLERLLGRGGGGDSGLDGVGALVALEGVVDRFEAVLALPLSLFYRPWSKESMLAYCPSPPSLAMRSAWVPFSATRPFCMNTTSSHCSKNCNGRVGLFASETEAIKGPKLNILYNFKSNMQLQLQFGTF